jgi:16S rRNA (cytosine967-C5)-methyltransferase
MGAPTAARAAALEALRAVRRGVLAGRALEAAARDLDPRARAWVHELVYGTLRLRGRLDHRVAAWSNRPLERVDPDVLDILRLGAYQLVEMSGVPAYAAVSQSVELARRVPGQRRASGFVNAVLQSLRRSGTDAVFPAFERDPADWLSTWGSHPRWLVERWLSRYGPDAARRLVEANNRRPELYLRILGDVAAGTALLLEAGMAVEPVDGAPRSLRLTGGSVAEALEAAPAIVQDPAAGLVVTYASAPAGSTVIDLAAAPGGKALALACDEPCAGPAFVVAADASAARLSLLVDNVARLERVPRGPGAAVPLRSVVADGRRPPFRGADMVLLDAPCTGTGTFRRHPDGRWRVRPEDVTALAALQAELLAAAAALVPPAGLLVYATCSLEPEENEAQVRAFLERHDDFAVESGPALDGGVLHGDGTLRVLPHDHGWDGAYAARLRRRG